MIKCYKAVYRNKHPMYYQSGNRKSAIGFAMLELEENDTLFVYELTNNEGFDAGYLLIFEAAMHLHDEESSSERKRNQTASSVLNFSQNVSKDSLEDSRLVVNS